MRSVLIYSNGRNITDAVFGVLQASGVEYRKRLQLRHDAFERTIFRCGVYSVTTGALFSRKNDHRPCNCLLSQAALTACVVS